MVAAVNASISTPVRPVTRTVAVAGGRCLLGRSEDLRYTRGEIKLVVVADHREHVRQRGQVAGTSGRVAAGRDDANRRVVARDAADRLPRTLVRARGHRTGVDDDEIGALRRCAHAAGGAQILLDAKRVRLVHPAAEGDDGVVHVEVRGARFEVRVPGAGYAGFTRAAAASTFSASLRL